MDPTMGKIIRLWDIDGENPHIPEEKELNTLLKNVGYSKITLDGNKVTLPAGSDTGPWGSRQRDWLRCSRTGSGKRERGFRYDPESGRQQCDELWLKA